MSSSSRSKRPRPVLSWMTPVMTDSSNAISTWNLLMFPISSISRETALGEVHIPLPAAGRPD